MRVMVFRDRHSVVSLSVLLFILSFVSLPVAAVTYYVDADAGSDLRSGRSPSLAWKTLNRVNSTAFEPGDVILLHRGQMWRERLTPQRSGIDGSPITYGAYSTGDAPVINGANVVTGWSGLGNGRYSASVSTGPEVVILGGVKGTRVGSAADVDVPLEWYWESGTLTVYSAAAPVNVEASAREHLFANYAKDYLVVRDMVFRYGDQPVYMVNANHCVLENIMVHDSAGYAGITLVSGAPSRADYNTIRGCTVYNISGNTESLASGNDADGILLYDVNCQYNLVEQCTVHHCGREGIVIFGGSDNTIRNCVAHHQAHGGLRVGLESAMRNVIEHCESYSNCLKADDRYGIDLIRVGDNNTVRYNVVHDQYDTLSDPSIPADPTNNGQKYGSGGIRFDGGNWADHDHMGSVGNRAHYNLVYNEGSGIQAYNFSNVEIYNNVVYNSRTFGLCVHSDGAVVAAADVVKNNAVSSATGAHVFFSRVDDPVFDHNTYFPDRSNAFRVRVGSNYYSYAFSAWRTFIGGDAGSLADDPKFVDSAGHDFHLQDGSPAIDLGSDVGLTVDFEGTAVPQGDGVDMGAFEHPADPPTLTVVQPNGGETWTAGSPLSIQWAYKENPGQYVQIELIHDGVPETLAAAVPMGENGAGAWTWSIPVGEPGGSAYAIRVTSVTNQACTDTSDGAFTIVAAPQDTLTVAAPNGGESWTAGDARLIDWSWTGTPASTVTIELLNGAVAETLADGIAIGTGGVGSWSWDIAPTQMAGSAYRVRITAGAVTDVSDDVFAINPLPPPTVQVVAPNGGESFMGGTSTLIEWKYSHEPGETVMIELISGAGTEVLAAGVAVGRDGEGSWAWNIDAGLAARGDYRIRVSSETYAGCTDESDGAFAIEAPPVDTLHVTTPNGGEAWMSGDTEIVGWSFTGDPGSAVNIDLVHGAEWVRLATGVPVGASGTGTWTWAIPIGLEARVDYQIRVTSTTQPECVDASDGLFSIGGLPVNSITVLKPNGDENWLVWDRPTITWSYTGSPGGTVRIELLADGQLHTVLTTSTSIGSNGAGSWTWNIPISQQNRSDYRIRVTSVDDPTCTDTSDGEFTVNLMPNVHVEQPDGDEEWRIGESREIRWSYGGNPGSRVRIKLLRGGATTTLAADVSIGTNGLGTWMWNIPLTQPAANNYLIRIEVIGFIAPSDNSDGEFSITLIPPEAGGTIVVPVGGKAYVSTGATLLAEVLAGSEPMTYQWLHDGSPVAGATDATYDLVSVDHSGAGEYACRITNSAGSDTTIPGALLVADPLTITQQPVGENVAAGQSYEMRVVASGGFAPLSYEWYREGVSESICSGDCLRLDPVTATDSGAYYAVVHDGYNSVVQSETAVVRVDAGLPAAGPWALGFLAGFLTWGMGRRVRRSSRD